MTGTQNLAALLPADSLFGGCAPAELEALAARGNWARFVKGDEILRQGDPGSSVIVLTEGTVRISMISSNGREIVLDYAEPGALLGEIALLDGGERTASVTGVTAGAYLRLSENAFRDFVFRNPETGWRLLKELARRLRVTNQTVESDRAFPSGPRLARYLQRLSRTDSEGDGSTLRMALSQTELGNFAGMSREHINRQLSQWADAGVIALDHGRIRILDSTLLMEIAETSD